MRHKPCLKKNGSLPLSRAGGGGASRKIKEADSSWRRLALEGMGRRKNELKLIFVNISEDTFGLTK